MIDFFNFKNMISNSLVKILYFIGFISITLGGVGLISNNEAEIGLSLLIFGNLFWRLFCEGIIIIFSIHENLVSISKYVESIKQNQDMD